MTQRGLPRGFHTRPATFDDLDAVVDLINNWAITVIGQPVVDHDDISNDWQSSVLHVTTDTQCVFTEDDELIGYAEVWDRGAPHVILSSWIRVHPDYEGQGIGSYLIHWSEMRAEQSISQAPEGARVVLRQDVARVDKIAQARMEAHSYEVIRRFFRMVIELDTPPPEPDVPDGISLRTFVRDEDMVAVVHAEHDAFRDHWGFVERPLEQEVHDWAQYIDTRSDFDPNLWFLAMDGEDIAGFCLCYPKTTEDPGMGWIAVLGVRRPWRRQGLALALLHHAFGVFYRRGKERAGLGVDAGSLTGALRLYKKAGMYVQRQSLTYEKELRAGEDLSVQSVEP